jgi:hypothetical protein
MTNQNQELLFIFAGITYAGAMLLTLAVLAAIRRLKAPKPPKVIPVYFAALEALRLQHRRPPPKTAKQHIKLAGDYDKFILPEETELVSYDQFRKQHIPTSGRYTRDWENLEERWNK